MILKYGTKNGRKIWNKKKSKNIEQEKITKI